LFRATAAGARASASRDDENRQFQAAFHDARASTRKGRK
jgi:hypothetical protein